MSKDNLKQVESSSGTEGHVQPIVRVAVETYQCPGCVCGHDITCYEKSEGSIACKKHVAGTIIFPAVGKFFLGLPKGFCRIGDTKMVIEIFESFEKFWGYDWLNVPVWKHLDEHGNTLIRGLMPRINEPFLHIFMGDMRDKIDCKKITQKELDKID